MAWAGFFINVPIGLAMILLAPRFLPETIRVRGRFDIVGALTATLGVGAIVFAIIHAAEAGWTSPLTLRPAARAPCWWRCRQVNTAARCQVAASKKTLWSGSLTAILQNTIMSCAMAREG